MSPLACSLFVLAALFAAMHAHVDPYCSELDRGNLTDLIISDDSDDIQEITSRILAHPGDVDIPNLCPKPDTKLVGEKIIACNRPNYKPLLTPVANHTDDLSLVHLVCPASVPGCDPVELMVVQTCLPANNTFW